MFVYSSFFYLSSTFCQLTLLCTYNFVYKWFIQGQEKEPKLPPLLAPSLLFLLNSSNMHPVKVVHILYRSICVFLIYMYC